MECVLVCVCAHTQHVKGQEKGEALNLPEIQVAAAHHQLHI